MFFEHSAKELVSSMLLFVKCVVFIFLIPLNINKSKSSILFVELVFTWLCVVGHVSLCAVFLNSVTNRVAGPICSFLCFLCYFFHFIGYYCLDKARILLGVLVGLTKE